MEEITKEEVKKIIKEVELEKSLERYNNEKERLKAYSNIGYIFLLIMFLCALYNLVRVALN